MRIWYARRAMLGWWELVSQAQGGCVREIFVEGRDVEGRFDGMGWDEGGGGCDVGIDFGGLGFGVYLQRRRLLRLREGAEVVWKAVWSLVSKQDSAF